MSTQTTNLGLTKPSGNEKPLVSVLNTDLDIIDEAVGDVDVQADGSLQDQIDALGESVSWTTPSGGNHWFDFAIPGGYTVSLSNNTMTVTYKDGQKATFTGSWVS